MHGLYVVELHNCVHMQGILLLNGIKEIVLCVTWLSLDVWGCYIVVSNPRVQRQVCMGHLSAHKSLNCSQKV